MASRLGNRRLASDERTDVAPSVVDSSLGRSADVAWLLAVPYGLALIAVVALIGPLLGDALAAPPRSTFWPVLLESENVLPEPAERAQYLLAIAGAVGFSALVALLRERRAPVWASRRAVMSACQVGLGAFVVLCVVLQRAHQYSYYYTGRLVQLRVGYFTAATLVVAFAIAGALALALRDPRIGAYLTAAPRETRARRLAGLALVLALLVTWALSAYYTDLTFGNAHEAVREHLPYWTEETFAVLNGRGPLVDFHAQYAQLLPYAFAAAMWAFGTELGVYSAIMLTGTVAAMLAVFAIFRRIVRSTWLACALFAPFVATSFFMAVGPLENRWAPPNVFSLFPMRYAGPYVLAWLIARHLDGARPRRTVPIFLVAGLVAINNIEFGVPAFGATLIALAMIERPFASAIRRVLRDAAIGLAGAIALASLLVLAGTGSLPDYAMLFTFAYLFGVEGFQLLPMPGIGLHLVVFVTFAAALAVATVRCLDQDEDPVLTGMLAWAGVFGLGVGSYFMGRSHPEVLIMLFSAWALALILLLIVCVRAIVRRPSRRAMPAELLVLVGFGIFVCSLAQIPTPWSQIERLSAEAPPPAYVIAAKQFLRQLAVPPDEPIVVFSELGHRIAYELGLDDINPWAEIGSIGTEEQLREMTDALHAAGGHLILLSTQGPIREQIDVLADEGFQPVAEDEARQTFLLSDATAPESSGP